MRLEEYIVLETLNIASTRHSRPGAVGELPDYGATAAQIAEVVNTDERFARERQALGRLSTQEVAGQLRNLARGPRTRREPLVERTHSRRWRLTEAALKVLIA